MPKTTIIRAAIFAIAATPGVSMDGIAQAVVTPPLALQFPHTQSKTTQIWWVHRHHRRRCYR